MKGRRGGKGKGREEARGRRNVKGRGEKYLSFLFMEYPRVTLVIIREMHDFHLDFRKTEE